LPARKFRATFVPTLPPLLSHDRVLFVASISVWSVSKRFFFLGRNGRLHLSSYPSVQPTIKPRFVLSPQIVRFPTVFGFFLSVVLYVANPPVLGLLFSLLAPPPGLGRTSHRPFPFQSLLFSQEGFTCSSFFDSLLVPFPQSINDLVRIWNLALVPFFMLRPCLPVFSVFYSFTSSRRLLLIICEFITYSTRSMLVQYALFPLQSFEKIMPPPLAHQALPPSLLCLCVKTPTFPTPLFVGVLLFLAPIPRLESHLRMRDA